MQRICVFCGSNSGNSPEYLSAAVELGNLLPENGIGLVYGGSNIGLMGALADAVLKSGGHVTGVIPQSLVDREVAHGGLSDLRIVESMHERKALMADLADGFVALPGGYGTFDELCEILTWAQLGIHTKPIGLLNTLGYWEPFMGFLDHAVTAGFLGAGHRRLLGISDTAPALLAMLRSSAAPRPVEPKWPALR